MQGYFGNFVGGSGSGIKSIQTITVSSAFTGTTDTITISAVDTNNTVLLVGIEKESEDTRFCMNFQLTSSNSILATKNSTSSIPSFMMPIQIIEYKPEVVKSNQFVSSAYVPGQKFRDVTVTAVDLNKSLAFRHGLTSDRSDGGRLGEGARMTSTTNLRLSTNDRAANGTVRGQVIEFN